MKMERNIESREISNGDIMKFVKRIAFRSRIGGAVSGMALLAIVVNIFFDKFSPFVYAFSLIVIIIAITGILFPDIEDEWAKLWSDSGANHE